MGGPIAPREEQLVGRSEGRDRLGIGLLVLSPLSLEAPLTVRDKPSEEFVCRSVIVLLTVWTCPRLTGQSGGFR